MSLSSLLQKYRSPSKSELEISLGVGRDPCCEKTTKLCRPCSSGTLIACSNHGDSLAKVTGIKDQQSLHSGMVPDLACYDDTCDFATKSCASIKGYLLC